MGKAMESLDRLVEKGIENKELRDFIVNQLRKLNIVLLNLKIEGAKINQPHGISAISSELKKINDVVYSALENFNSKDVEVQKEFKTLRVLIEKLESLSEEE